MNETTGLPTNWLDTGPVNYTQTSTPILGNTVTTTDNTAMNWINGNSWYEPCQRQTLYYHWWPNWKETVKIRLTMSDVEKLRDAAKKDKTLKKVLNKLGPHIEVEVDFG